MKYPELIKDTDFFAGTDEFSYPEEEKRRNFNQRMNKISSIFFTSDRQWKHNDFTYDGLNIWEGPLEVGQQSYDITGLGIVIVDEISVKNSNGNYQVLQHVVREEGNGQRLQDLEESEGMPKFYELMGGSLFLYPRPKAESIFSGDNLKIIGREIPNYFDGDDPLLDEREPGFSPLFHRYLSIGAAIDFAYANNMDRKLNSLQPKLMKMESDMREHYRSRSKTKAKATPKVRDYGYNL